MFGEAEGPGGSARVRSPLARGRPVPSAGLPGSRWKSELAGSRNRGSRLTRFPESARPKVAPVMTGATFGLELSGNLVNRDPRFRDPANSDFHLLPGSPALGTGRPLASGLRTLALPPGPSASPNIGAHQ